MKGVKQCLILARVTGAGLHLCLAAFPNLLCHFAARRFSST